VERCLHDFSPRQAENFVALNCGGLPDTLLDSELFGHEPGNIRELRNHADCRALGIARNAGTADATPQAGMTLSEAVETLSGRCSLPNCNASPAMSRAAARPWASRAPPCTTRCANVG
jgi:hypothetical protein